jgi:nucleotide-binding universal stress UspA family protein
VEFALGQRVDRVITGSSGRTPMTELYLGSVSNAVLPRFTGPVLVVR